MPTAQAVVRARAPLQSVAVPTAISYVRATMTEGPCHRVLIGTVVPTANAVLLTVATQ